MKKLKAIVSFALFSALMLTACGGGASSSAPSSAPAPESEAADSSQMMVGAYTEDRDVTDEDLAIFDAAMEGLTGVEYVPEKVATQVVAGTNYRFYAKATTVTQTPEEYYAYVYIFMPLGEDAVPELTEIEPIEG